MFLKTNIFQKRGNKKMLKKAAEGWTASSVQVKIMIAVLTIAATSYLSLMTWVVLEVAAAPEKYIDDGQLSSFRAEFDLKMDKICLEQKTIIKESKRQTEKEIKSLAGDIFILNRDFKNAETANRNWQHETMKILLDIQKQIPNK